MQDDPVILTAKPHAFAGAVLSPKHARELTPSLCLAIASALADQSHRKSVVPYTLWITEAWRVLGWAEPSAALFWEMATMYHALYLACRSMELPDHANSANAIPPILSCGSTSSLGSGTTEGRPVSFDKKKFSSSAASAKELPVWFVGTFLLLHCEDLAYHRNLSGHDERRFYGGRSPAGVELSLNGGKTDFTSLLHHSALSPRTRLHAGWGNDTSHCTAYLLRHLRKILLLLAMPHHPEAAHACMHLAALPASSSTNSASSPTRKTSDIHDIHRQHNEEHGQVGLNVRLTLDDLERLHLLIQPPQGGNIDELPLRFGEYFWMTLRSAPPPPMAELSLAEVEQTLRDHLELELLSANEESKDDRSVPIKAMSRLSLKDHEGDNDDDDNEGQGNTSQKELSYHRLRGTTILLKPSTVEPSSGASATSEHHFVGHLASANRLHDLTISDCSDAHFYLLQPFEHATISACTGCTIVVGAVAGILHVVDCEKTKITCASRRVLVSNSADTQLCIFTPSPPLLVGDNRNCQFAPYNTYYDGLREDLLATGLAVAVVPENQSPYHSGNSRGPMENDAAWPPLQCASNKWKLPIELSKLEMPSVPPSSTTPPASPTSSALSTSTPNSPGADDKAMNKAGTGNDTTVLAPVLLPSSEFHILFVPVESEAQRQRRLEPPDDQADENGPMESQYCKTLAEVLQLSPFRLPTDYERRVIVKADRMRNIQQAVQKNLTPEQQKRFEEEINRGFRDWLVTSGNLRQVLDLVHLERRGSV